MANNYGNKHREERRKRLDQLDKKQCELKNAPLEAHHNVPRLFNGVDLASNYSMLHTVIHNYLHQICNVTNTELVGERIKASNYTKKYILDDEKRQRGIDRIEELDNVMLAEYIARLVFNLSKDYEGVLFMTLLSNAKTIRDLSIENLRLEKTLENLVKGDE